jgi:Zn-dependent protease
MEALPLVLSLGAFALSLSVHESAHAWTAYRLGDPTGAAEGRITLNPIAHLDPIGSILLPILLWWGSNGTVVFGYAKPVRYNPYVFRNPALGSAAVAGAGPVSNFLLAGVSMVLLALVAKGGRIDGTLGHDFLLQMVLVNVTLGLFNLLPIPPLDGGTVLAGFLPRAVAARYARIEGLGLIFLLVIMQTRVFDRILSPVLSWTFERLYDLVRLVHG